MKPKFFKDQYKFRDWLEKNHDKEDEIIVGYYKKGSGKASITWPESVDQAICFGWIDGIRRSHEEDSYTIRFTPRRATSIWSAVNIEKAEKLKKEGLMHEAGLAAYGRRKEEKSKIYSFEQKPEHIVLPKDFEKTFKANKNAWTMFKAMPNSYQKTAIWWVISAKQEATKLRRLDTLIKDSESGVKVKPFRR